MSELLPFALNKTALLVAASRSLKSYSVWHLCLLFYLVFALAFTSVNVNLLLVYLSHLSCDSRRTDSQENCAVDSEQMKWKAEK
jgi:hypothetical protein